MIMIGISMVFVGKTNEKILQHRWILSTAIALTLSAAFLVMIPAAFSFYIDPDLEFFSSLFCTTLVHGIVGVPALATALIYAFGDLPQSTKKWMRISASLWIADLGLGVVLFVQMMGLM